MSGSDGKSLLDAGAEAADLIFDNHSAVQAVVMIIYYVTPKENARGEDDFALKAVVVDETAGPCGCGATTDDEHAACKARRVNEHLRVMTRYVADVQGAPLRPLN